MIIDELFMVKCDKVIITIISKIQSFLAPWIRNGIRMLFLNFCQKEPWMIIFNLGSVDRKCVTEANRKQIDDTVVMIRSCIRN